MTGRAAAADPLHKELAPGQYVVRAGNGRFQPVITSVNVIPGYQQEITLTLDPVAANPNYERAVEFEAQQLWPQAIASYEQALRDDPGSMAVYERLAAVYMRNGRYSDAVNLMSTAKQKFPDQAAILAIRSRAISAWVMSEDQPDKSASDSSPSAPEVEEKKDSGKKKKNDAGKEDDPSDQPSKKKGSKKGGKKNSGNDSEKNEAAELSRGLMSETGSRNSGSASGKAAEALFDAEAAVRINPNLAAAHLALGFALLLDQSSRSKALDAFVRASTSLPMMPRLITASVTATA
ncbi:MAG: tetratricopeptide repeat protein [Acidobacteria bacterium]|nr:tetratricopeptide repeat protein [Acidobacteriota bacterium]